MFAAEHIELVGLVCALFLTLAVFSRLIGDNKLFRFAQSLFVGVTSGYILALVLRSVIWPRILLLVQQPAQYWYYGLYFILGLMLLARGLRKTSALANLPLGMLFGIGASVTLGGTLAGTLIPQTRALATPLTKTSLNTWPAWALLLNGILILVGTLAVLGAFRFTLPQRGPGGFLSAVWSLLGRTLGRGLIMIILGALYAGALVSFYTLLVGRFSFLQQTISEVLGRLGI